MLYLKPLLLLGALFATLVACKPEVPFCENDEQCQTAVSPANVCVNGSCQECLEDYHCVANRGDGYFCNSGRCELNTKSERLRRCKTSLDCQDGQGCFKGLCTTPIVCSFDSQCGPGAGCFNRRCKKCSPEVLAARKVCEAQTSMVNFDFNQDDLSIETRQVLSNAAQCLKLRPRLNLIIEGHCDERGTQEYNLALGERRAQAVRSYLSNLGVDPTRMTTRTFGANQPKCEQSTEACYATNRRVEVSKIPKN